MTRKIEDMTALELLEELMDNSAVEKAAYEDDREWWSAIDARMTELRVKKFVHDWSEEG